MHTARVIAEHPANRAATVRRRIGTKKKPVFFRLLVQVIEHEAGLDPRELFLRVDLEHAVHVFREIDDDRDVAALSGQARAAPTTGDGCAEFSAKSDNCNDVVAIARQGDADRDLPVVRAVGRVKRAIAIAKSHFTADRGTQCGL